MRHRKRYGVVPSSSQYLVPVALRLVENFSREDDKGREFSVGRDLQTAEWNAYNSALRFLEDRLREPPSDAQLITLEESLSCGCGREHETCPLHSDRAKASCQCGDCIYCEQSEMIEHLVTRATISEPIFIDGDGI